MENQNTTLKTSSNPPLLGKQGTDFILPPVRTMKTRTDVVLDLESFVLAEKLVEKAKQNFADDLHSAFMLLAKRTQLQIEDVADSFPVWEFQQQIAEFQNLQHRFSTSFLYLSPSDDVARLTGIVSREVPK